MKKFILGGVTLVTFTAMAVNVDSVLVRQDWPWTSALKVEYRVSDTANSPFDVTVSIYNGETAVAADVVRSALTDGELYAVDGTESLHTLSFDPKVLFGTTVKAVPNVRVALDVAASTTSTEVLYKIFDLEAKSVTDVTRADLLNNKYGACTTDYGTIGTGFTTTLEDVLVWTGVTNYPGAKTTKIVMRKVNAANQTFTFGSEPGEVGRQSNETNVTVKLTEDFFIAVFELTQKQYNLIMGKGCGASSYGVGDSHPAHSFNLCLARGCRDYRVWNQDATDPAPVNLCVNWPNNTDYPHTYSYADTITRRARSLFNWAAEFDLPTEAQWEFACRGGSTTSVYSGRPVANSTVLNVELKPLAWIYFYNADWRVSETQVVGLKKPNAYGLYDMIGNVLEQCLDWAGTGVVSWASTETVTDPVGPTTYDDSKYRRRLRGGHVQSNWETEARIASRQYNHWGEFGNSYQVGCRLVCPATANGKWASSPEKTH